MPDTFDLFGAIHDHIAEIKSSLDDDSFRQFDERRKALAQESSDAQTDDELGRVTEQLHALLTEYPAVSALLGSEEQAAGPPPVRPEPTAPQAVTRTDQRGPAAGVGEQTDHHPPTRRNRSRDAARPSSSGESRWTPPLILELTKESVSALLGIGLVGFTCYLAFRTINLAGDSAKVTDSKDVLELLLGLSGVVLGYYFGRIPADARATQAQAQATEATKDAQRVRDTGEQLADCVEAMATRDTRGDGQFSADLAEIRRLQAQMRALTRLPFRFRCGRARPTLTASWRTGCEQSRSPHAAPPLPDLRSQLA